MNFTETEIYAIARFFRDLDWTSLQIDPLLALILKNGQNDKEAVLKVLGEDVARRALNVDGGKPLVLSTAQPSATMEVLPSAVPALPDSVGPTPQQRREAAQVGHLLNDYVSWAGIQANETPTIFHLIAGLVLGSMSIGRRMFIPTTWGEDVFPNLYVMGVAVSTFYHKTASLRLLTKVANNAFPYMLMPRPGSPENLLRTLSGEIMSDEKMQKLSEREREQVRLGAAFAAQRTIQRDEISGMFKGMNKDYMAGMKEHFMEMYDAPIRLEHSTNGRGLTIIRDVAPSLFGMTTPSELAQSVRYSDWTNGTLARFLLAAPEPNFTRREPADKPLNVGPMAARFHNVHCAIPMPDISNPDNEESRLEPWALAAPVWNHVRAYKDALQEMTKPTSTLDDRLRANYGRFHVQALKIATILAGFDWAETPDRAERPRVTEPYWFRALEITEMFRASAHRVLFDLSESEDAHTDRRIFNYLKDHPQGVTSRDIMRHTGLKAQAISTGLRLLLEAGEVEQSERKPARGPSAVIFKPADK